MATITSQGLFVILCKFFLLPIPSPLSKWHETILCFLDLYKILFIIIWFFYFSLSIILIFTYAIVCRNNSVFNCWIVFYCTNMLQFTYSFSWWEFRFLNCFQFGTITNGCAVSTWTNLFTCIICIASFLLINYECQILQLMVLVGINVRSICCLLPNPEALCFFLTQHYMS